VQLGAPHSEGILLVLAGSGPETVEGEGRNFDFAHDGVERQPAKKSFAQIERAAPTLSCHRTTWEKIMAKTLLEICCGSIDDAIQAEVGGADRVELCSALFLGGLTPSIGTIQEAKRRLKIPVVAMVRPRGGGFCYTEAEFATMERDAEAAVESGANGVVFGILKENGRIDQRRTKRMRRIISERQVVFHRAFDVTPDPFGALEELIDLGITRVLTSGQKNSVPEGVELIAKLVTRAGKRIEILPGGGIRPYNLQDILKCTRCRQVHMTAWGKVQDRSTHAHRDVTFGGALQPAEDVYDRTDARLVKEIVKGLRKA
jgi:copper homeostasis protein